MRSTLFSTAPSRCKRKRSRLGTDSTHWRTGGQMKSYTLCSTAFTGKMFGKGLIGLNFRPLQRKADFRFGLVRVREHAEPITFYDGEAREMSTLQRIFAAVYANYQRVLRWQFGLDLFQYTLIFLMLVLPTAILAHHVHSGELEGGWVPFWTGPRCCR